MHSYSRKKIIPYQASIINQIILDVEKYPEFLPWCSAARIISQNDNVQVAELTISFKGFAESYKSRIISNKEHGIYSIEIEAISGPFEFLKNNWQIKSFHQASEVNFDINFQLKSKILDMMIKPILIIAAEKIMNAFEMRIKKHDFLQN